MRPFKNPAISIILKKTMDFFEVTGGRVLSFRNVSVGEPAGPDLSDSPMDTLLKRPAREPGTEKKPIVFRSRGVLQRSPIVSCKRPVAIRRATSQALIDEIKISSFSILLSIIFLAAIACRITYPPDASVSIKNNHFKPRLCSRYRHEG